ncbi:MATE family efflux transporter, partial [Haloferax volcanii]
MSLPEGGSLTEGDLKRPMFELAWPIIVTELLQVAYNLADTVWLGRLSTDA